MAAKMDLQPIKIHPAMPHEVKTADTDAPPRPLVFPIHEGLKPMMEIRIKGRPLGDSHKFTVSLQHGYTEHISPDIALFMDVRSYDRTVVLKRRENNVWDPQEIKITQFPFHPDAVFFIVIKVTAERFGIEVNGQQMATFDHRFEDLSRINCVFVENDIHVTLIRYEQTELN